jgi:hypothetical protein
MPHGQATQLVILALCLMGVPVMHGSSCTAQGTEHLYELLCKEPVLCTWLLIRVISFQSTSTSKHGVCHTCSCAASLVSKATASVVHAVTDNNSTSHPQPGYLAGCLANLTLAQHMR